MRNQRSSFIWVLAALVAIECCVVVYFYIQDGRPRYLAAALTPIARSPHVALDRHDSGPSVVVHQPSPTPVAVGRSLATEKPAPSLSKKLATSQQRIMAQRTVVADSSAFAYAGRWEHIAGKRDGRSGGKSSRTFAHGARATLTFNGRFVRLYGILGPGGGFGAVRIDGAPGKIVDFFAPSK
ncbi:MAG: hypothetical protein IAI50_21630, partial [Candidatus Eremiobacteraeota bacterium]|nr:hypothetical protein [Candidatus Eremiobacteraeota bacterium]